MPSVKLSHCACSESGVFKAGVEELSPENPESGVSGCMRGVLGLHRGVSGCMRGVLGLHRGVLSLSSMSQETASTLSSDSSDI